MFRNAPKTDGTPPLAIEHLEGFCIDLAKAVAEEYQFDWVIHAVKDNKYGKEVDNGTWNGMVGELIRDVRYWRRLFVYWKILK